MELVRLIAALGNPAAYPHAVDAVEVRQTHISVVFLAGPFAYKLKKPVDLGFLDFTTLSKRLHFCEEEVRLNRRLAPAVYLGVVPITQGTTAICFEGDGAVVEWAVKMERLPEGASLLERLRRGEVGAPLIETLAGRVAAFHARAERGNRIAEFGRFDVVARNARENFEQAVPRIGDTVSRAVFDRLRVMTEEALVRLQPLIEARAKRGVPCDTHGDLHLDHVYSFPDRAAPHDLIAIDCIEFNERFRHADPVADAAFLVMDLHFRAERDLADVFAAAYFRAAGDAEGAALLPFYTAYRAAIRAKVEGFQIGEMEIAAAERMAARTRSRAYWLLALGELAKPAERPALVLIGGLPGTGKSTLARGLAEGGRFSIIRSDLVRKELAGLSPDALAPSAVDRGIYTPEMTARTYAECLRRAEGQLFEGMRVIVDATFADDGQRLAFLELAARLGVPTLWLVCRSSSDAARQRVENRRGDASDADVSVYEWTAKRWQEPGPQTRAILRELNTDAEPEHALARAIEQLRAARLMNRVP